ncbi:hypothetical protein JP74_21330 [Devosia sp. 17-2-E-8]|nr:hypothetical protein JP74_21330 [Devosia sp. 17-2-E-8]
MPFIYMEDGGKCLMIGDEMAVWDKPASGDKFAPYKHPEQHLKAVYFHSKNDYYAEAASASVPVTHAAYPASAAVSYDPSALALTPVTIYPDTYTSSRVLMTHGLGYVPKFLIADENYNELPASAPIQYANNENGGTRFVRHYATTTQIVQVEYVVPGIGPMASLSKTYRVVVFRKPQADPSKPVFQAKRDGNILIAGRGKVNYSEKHLRLADAGETAFHMPTEPVYDINNGQVRYVRSGGFWIESVAVRGATVIRYGGSLTSVDYLSVVA